MTFKVRILGPSPAWVRVEDYEAASAAYLARTREQQNPAPAHIYGAATRRLLATIRPDGIVVDHQSGKAVYRPPASEPKP